MPVFTFFCSIIILIGSQNLFAQANNAELLTSIREQLPEAFKKDEVCSALMKEVINVKSPDPLLKGYMGGVYIARSKHAPLLDKRSALKTGTTLLEQAITEKPNNIELLFLRLSIQLNLPGFLGYNDNIDDDKAFVLQNYRKAPTVLKARIINFINTSGYFTESEKQMVTN